MIILAAPAGNIPYLFAAFIICWAVFFGYVFFTSRQQRELDRRMTELREGLEREGRSREGS